jgi:hypothetical protein
MSEPLYQSLEPRVRDRAERVDQELEGLGTMTLYFVELADLPIELPAPPKPGLPARIRETVGLGLRAFPRLIGIERS